MTCPNVAPLVILALISILANVCQFVAGGWLLKRVLELMNQLDARRGRKLEPGGRSTVGPPQLSNENLLASYVLAARVGGADLVALEAEVLRRMGR